MSEPNEELHDYLFKLSRVRASALTFLAGFSFTVLSLFLNQLPDPTTTMSQITLFFLTLIFEFFLFLSVWQLNIVLTTCAPAHIVHKAYTDVFKTEVATFSFLMLVGLSMLGTAVVLIFMLWNLFYLALASGLLWVFFGIATYIMTRKSNKRLRLFNKQEKE